MWSEAEIDGLDGDLTRQECGEPICRRAGYFTCARLSSVFAIKAGHTALTHQRDLILSQHAEVLVGPLTEVQMTAKR
jgi:hypothetical protein